MPEREDLDSLIDSALASYADPGPSSGLERRVLARIRPTSARHRRLLIWAAGLPAAAALSVLFLLISNTAWRMEPHPRPETGAHIVPPPPSPSGKFDVSPRVVIHSGVHARRAPRHTTLQASALPKQDVFPSPLPLTIEEKALVGLVAGTPAPQRQHLAVWLQPAEPIHIAAISIPPINPPAEGKEQ